MLRRFSLYGFLKNQQYYEYFFMLALTRSMGLSYTWYGILIAFREIMTNVMEIPTGAVADVCGRRRSMMGSMVAYIMSFVVFGLSGIGLQHHILAMGTVLPLLFLAMSLFAIGDAFRTGTHKAMIFSWLRIQGRTDERTKVYGYTRSWSKIGSAVSVVIACVIVFVANDFIYVFFFAIIPYVLNILNFVGYPKEVDGEVRVGATLRELMGHLKETFVMSVRKPGLRRLMLESMGFEGFFKAAKDYLQPILFATALPLAGALFADLALTETQSSVFLLGPAYVILFLLSATASRKAHLLVDRHGSEEAAAKWLWGITLVVFVLLLPAMWYGVHVGMIGGFVALYVLQNLWRPVLISRFDAHADENRGATVLSIESQAKSVATMILAPLVGLAIDRVKAGGLVGGAGGEFWPLGMVGGVLALAFFLTACRGGEPDPAEPTEAPTESR